MKITFSDWTTARRALEDIEVAGNPTLYLIKRADGQWCISTERMDGGYVAIVRKNHTLITEKGN